MLKIKRQKRKKKKPDYKKWQTPFVHHEKVYNLQMKTSTKTLYRPQFGFRQAERKKKNLKTLFLTTKSKTVTSRLQKKEKQRNPLKRTIIKKKA